MVDGVEAVPLKAWFEYHRCEELDPDSGLGVTDQEEPVSTEIDATVVVSL
jgi:hypothetical protein